MNKNTVAVPIEYVTETGKGAFGKFRFPEHHILTIGDQPAVHESIRESADGEVRRGSLVVPEAMVAPLGNVALRLAAGLSQQGLFTGGRVPEMNCASFVHDVTQVPFDTHMLTDTTRFNGWTPASEDKPVDIGDVRVYLHRADEKKWTHWAVEVGGDVAGVMGLGGANGHGITVANSQDVERALGHHPSTIATNPNYQK